MANNQSRLFRAAEPTHLNACVGDNGGPVTLVRLAEGYFEAGATLCLSLMARKTTGHIDCLIYPLASNFRHGLELYLKHMVHQARELNGSNKAGETLEGHDLNKAFNTFFFELHKLIEQRPEIAGWFEINKLNDAKALIKDFHALDPGNVTFRYTETKQGKPLLKDQGCINALVLSQEMSALHENLEHWTIGLDALIEQRDIAAWEARSNQETS